MWISGHEPDKACIPDNHPNCCADRCGDTGHANRNTDTQANTRCNASATADDASTRVGATNP